MTAAGPKRYLIRVRWERGAYASSTMPQAEAESKAAELENAVIGCGDGPGFVRMVGHDGRTLRIRAREIIGIECNPHVEDSSEPSRPHDRPAAGGMGPHVVDGTLEYRGAAPGTAFLQRQAAHTGSLR